MIADYYFTNSADDVTFLRDISGVASMAFCPFIAAAESGMAGLDHWTDLSKPRDLAKIFESVEYASWRSFRESEDSRFVVLTMPRTLARLPYGSTTKPIEEFHFEEIPLAESGKFSAAISHSHYTWMNTSFVVGAQLTKAFAAHGWCTAIRGAENGGKVEGLCSHVFVTDDGDIDQKCPTEIAITDRREAELSRQGFFPLSHYKNTDYAVFFGAQTIQAPKVYDTPQATSNAAISSRLPYILATSRFAHYLKVIARDKIGSFMEQGDCELFLNRWITRYVAADSSPPALVKAKYPLAQAKVQVTAVPGSPGAYHAVAWLRPWLQFEELTTSLRLVAEIP
jgi:type VI secretion system protein ImpC